MEIWAFEQPVDEDPVLQSKAPKRLPNSVCSYCIVLKFNETQQQSLSVNPKEEKEIRGL